MCCLPYVQQRTVQSGTALARCHNVERTTVAAEFRIGQASGHAWLPGKQVAHTSACRRGGRRCASWRSPAVCLEGRPELVDLEGIRDGRGGEVAALFPDQCHKTAAWCRTLVVEHVSSNKG